MTELKTILEMCYKFETDVSFMIDLDLYSSFGCDSKFNKLYNDTNSTMNTFSLYLLEYLKFSNIILREMSNHNFLLLYEDASDWFIDDSKWFDISDYACKKIGLLIRLEMRRRLNQKLFPEEIHLRIILELDSMCI